MAAELLTIEPLADGRLGLRLSGEADLTTVEALRKSLAPLVAGDGDLELELDGLCFIDVGSASQLAQAAAGLRPGRRLVVHDAPASLGKIVDVFWSDLPTLEVRVRPSTSEERR